MTQFDMIDKFEAYETEATFTRGNKMTTQVVAMDDIRTVVADIAEELANGVNTESKALHIDSVKARYFRVTFSANHPKGAANGAVMYVTNGTYLGAAETIADIEKTNGVTNVAILSITELAEDDYNYYVNH